MRVDFPEPFSPAMQWICPLDTDIETSESALAPPKLLTIFLTPYSVVIKSLLLTQMPFFWFAMRCLVTSDF